jgi:hypothetical protein
MLCPKCKNPINDNAAVCEWCGSVTGIYKNNDVKSGVLGIASIVFGILGFLIVTIPPAIIIGIMGWGRGKKFRELAITGFIMGCFWLIFLICVLIFYNTDTIAHI